MERERDSFGILYTGYLLSIVKIKREIERDRERGRKRERKEREREREREREKEGERERKERERGFNVENKLIHNSYYIALDPRMYMRFL